MKKTTASYACNLEIRTVHLVRKILYTVLCVYSEFHKLINSWLDKVSTKMLQYNIRDDSDPTQVRPLRELSELWVMREREREKSLA